MFFIANGIHIISFILLLTPVYGLFSMPIGINVFQTSKDEYGVRNMGVLDIFEYRNRLLRVYLFLLVGLRISVLAAVIGRAEDRTQTPPALF